MVTYDYFVCCPLKILQSLDKAVDSLPSDALRLSYSLRRVKLFVYKSLNSCPLNPQQHEG